MGNPGVNAADHPVPVIVHETSTWLVLNKPAGWHTVAPGRATARRRQGSLPPTAAPDVETWLRSQPQFAWSQALDEAGIVHRLDFETSGCLLVARTSNEQQRLRDAFQRGGGVRKIYLAIIASAPSKELRDRGEFRFFFTSRHKRSKRITVRTEGDPRHEGRCSWRVLQRAAVREPIGDLVEVELLGPGRRHQIRAGFAALGHPILGDQLYGCPAQAAYSRPAARSPAAATGLALHAWKLIMTGDSKPIICPTDLIVSALQADAQARSKEF